MNQYDSHSFRKWLYTHCQIISREGMTSLLLKTNTEKTCVTSCWFLASHSSTGKYIQEAGTESSHLFQCRTYESPAGNRVTLSPYVFQISYSAGYCSLSGIPLHLDQLLCLLVFSFLLSSDHLDLMSPSCSKRECTMQYKCLQLQFVYKYMQKRVQTSLKWPHFSLLCSNIALSGCPG